MEIRRALEEQIAFQQARLDLMRSFEARFGDEPQHVEFAVFVATRWEFRVWRTTRNGWWQWTRSDWANVTRTGGWPQFLSVLLKEEVPGSARIHYVGDSETYQFAKP